MPRKANKKTSNVSESVRSPETQSVQNTEQPTDQLTDAVEKLREAAGTGGGYCEVEIRRLGDPPHGGYIGRMQFMSTDHLIDLPDNIASRYGGGVYRVQLVKARMSGGRMQYASPCSEMAIGGEPLPIQRIAKPDRSENERAQERSQPAPNVGPQFAVPQYHTPPQPAGLTFEQAIALAKTVVPRDSLNPMELLTFAKSMMSPAPTQPHAYLDPNAQLDQMMRYFEFFQHMNKSAEKKRSHFEDDDEDAISMLGGSSMLDKAIGLILLRQFQNGDSGNNSARESNPDNSERAKTSTQQKLPTDLKPPDLPGKWAYMPGSGWIRIDDDGDDDGDEYEQSEDDESENEHGEDDAEQDDADYSADRVSEFIRKMPKAERDRYIAEIAMKGLGVDPRVVNNFIPGTGTD